MKSLSKIILLFVAIVCVELAFGQSDSTSVSAQDSVSKDTTKSNSILFRPPSEWTGPEKSGIMSTLVPGLGQVNNKKYWKLPLIYGIGSFLVASAIYHHREYKIARDGLRDTTWSDSVLIPVNMRGGTLFVRDAYTIESESQYKTSRDSQRSNRDRFIVLSGLFYALQIVDAVVDAHLNEFDLSDDLSLEINPNIYAINNKFAAQVSLNFRLK